jgi:hypothetical protein
MPAVGRDPRLSPPAALPLFPAICVYPIEQMLCDGEWT